MDRDEVIDKIEELIVSEITVDDCGAIHIEGIAKKIFDLAEDYFLSRPEYSDGYVD